MARNTAQGQGESRAHRSRRDPDTAMATMKQIGNPLDSDLDGVVVAFDGVQYQVDFPYSPTLAIHMAKIDGAEFDRDAKIWTVPLVQYDALSSTLPAMRKELKAELNARGAIEDLAYGSAIIKMDERGAGEAARPRLSSYLAAGQTELGEIIAVNSHFAAQLTGFGKDDGAAFVKIHRLSDISESVFKGDNVAITYDDKGRGTVTYRQSLEEKLDESLGKYVDGVKVVESEGQYKVAFDYNPTLAERLQRIDGVEWNDDEKRFEVGVDKKTFLARAVNDMRKEVVADRADRKEIEAQANEKIDGVKVKNAFTKDGIAHTGKIIATNSRYVLQHSGKDNAEVHRADSLNEKPEVGKTVRIVYERGRGRVTDRDQSQEHGHGR